MAIVGYGLSGRCFHAPLIATTEGLEVCVVVTSNAERRAEAEREHPGVRVVDGYEEALAERPDLVVVAVPNTDHVEVADGAIAAGIPLVVDKPLASTVVEAEGIVARARAAGVPLTVFQNRRWDSDQLTLRRLLGEGALGEVTRYESRFERWRPTPKGGAWREELSSEEGGGVLLDLGSHLIDQAIDLFGPPTSVYAEVAARRAAAAPTTTPSSPSNTPAAPSATSGARPSRPCRRRACGSKATPPASSSPTSTHKRRSCAPASGPAAPAGACRPRPTSPASSAARSPNP